jgi:hypothetical protein
MKVPARFFPVTLEAGINKYTAGNRNTRCSKAVPKAACRPDERSAPQDISFFGGSDSAWVAQLVERVLGKDEVTGSIPVPGSRNGVGFL